jgi:glucosamine-6-phosphate deaminase
MPSEHSGRPATAKAALRRIDAATPHDFAQAAADWVCGRLRDKPASVLALPTGNTPLGLYSELITRSRAGTASLAGARIFNLDEYCGLAPSDPHSYSAFLQRHLIEPAGLAADKVRLLRGDATDLEAECRDYDAALAACGGIDACILGLGVNGHIAFNEPGSSWELATHVVHLSHATRAAHERQAQVPWNIPVCGITMGIKTVLEARHILLLIAGTHKEAARQAFYAGVADADWPVTSLLAHPHVTVIELCGPSASR